MLDKLIQGLQRENLALGSKQHAAHVLPPDPKAPAIDTGNKLKALVLARLTLIPDSCKLLDPGHLVAGRAVIPGNLGLNDVFQAHGCGGAFLPQGTSLGK